MKRLYFTPTLSSMQTIQELPLAASGVTSSNGIGYGGVDQDGSMEACIKEDISVFNWE